MVVEEGNPDDAAVEKSGTGGTAALPFRPWICQAQFGKELTSTPLSIALSCNNENMGYTNLNS